MPFVSQAAGLELLLSTRRSDRLQLDPAPPSAFGLFEKWSSRLLGTGGALRAVF